MKARFFTLTIALAGLFTLSSFMNVYSQIAVPVTGTTGTCTFTGVANISLGNNGQNVVATGTLTGLITNTDDNGTPLDPTDDPADEVVNQPINETVSLMGTTCTNLQVTPLDGAYPVGSNCGSMNVTFASVFYPYKPGGQANLITNSLCAIARYYENGQQASINSLFAHVANFMRAITR